MVWAAFVYARRAADGSPLSASELAVQVMVPFGLDTLTLRGSWFDLETPGRSSYCPSRVTFAVGGRLAAAAAACEGAA
jgi:hypothetical protein